MEFAYLTPTSVKLKGKQVTITTGLVNGKNKTVADATLLLGKETSTEFSNPTNGMIFQGAGEYEVKGTKITGFRMSGDVMYTVHIDGMSVFVGNVSSALVAKDQLHEHDIAMLIADDVLSQTSMGILNARVMLFAGEKAEENAKAFGKETATVGKYAITKDKLPAETEFVFLG